MEKGRKSAASRPQSPAALLIRMCLDAMGSTQQYFAGVEEAIGYDGCSPSPARATLPGVPAVLNFRRAPIPIELYDALREALGRDKP